MPANIITFDSNSSPYRNYRIEQDHAPITPVAHDHRRDPETGQMIEPEVDGDGWISRLVRISDNATIGEFRFTGEAMAAMRGHAAEDAREQLKKIEPVEESE